MGMSALNFLTTQRSNSKRIMVYGNLCWSLLKPILISESTPKSAFHPLLNIIKYKEKGVVHGLSRPLLLVEHLQYLSVHTVCRGYIHVWPDLEEGRAGTR
jgi:hypothetical protein